MPGQGQEGQRGLISFRTLSITWATILSLAKPPPPVITWNDNVQGPSWATLFFMDYCFLHLLLLPMVLLRFGVRKRFTPTEQVKVVVSRIFHSLDIVSGCFHKHTRLFPNRKHNPTIAVYPPCYRNHAWP